MGRLRAATKHARPGNGNGNGNGVELAADSREEPLEFDDHGRAFDIVVDLAELFTGALLVLLAQDSDEEIQHEDHHEDAEDREEDQGPAGVSPRFFSFQI